MLVNNLHYEGSQVEILISFLSPRQELKGTRGRNLAHKAKSSCTLPGSINPSFHSLESFRGKLYLTKRDRGKLQ
jgi:hypothetical protein